MFVSLAAHITNYTCAGINAPGFEDRRRERIKATYGIDVPAKS